MMGDGFDLPDFGHNKPPSAIDWAREAAESLSAWLKDHPAIVDEETARLAKLRLDRSDGALKDLEAIRDSEAKPIYERWKAVRERYAPAVDRLSKLLEELKARMTAFARAEKARRDAEAAEARRVAEEAARAAAEASDRAWEAKENAAVGDLEADVGATIAEADAKIAEAKRAERAASIAEHSADHVAIGGGFKRASGLRTHKIILIDDPAKVIAALTWPNKPLPEKLIDAMVTAVRAYQKSTGKLPEGAREVEERRL
jgi:hypothetical protein